MRASVLRVFMADLRGKAGCRHRNATGAKRNGGDRPVLDVGHCTHWTEPSPRLTATSVRSNHALCERRPHPLSFRLPRANGMLMAIAIATADWYAFHSLLF